MNTKSSDGKPEPRSMTLVDLVALVAGVALGYRLIQGNGADWHVVPPPLVRMLTRALWTFQGAGVAFAVVAMGRVSAYRRLPRPAEWLTIALAAWVVADIPDLYAGRWAYDIAYTQSSWAERFNMDAWWRVLAAIAGLLALVVAGAVVAGRRLPPWAKVVALAGAAVLALAGPIDWFARFGADLVSPSGGFGPGDLAIFHRLACGLVAVTPYGIFFGVPALATLADRARGRPWAWGEWAGVTASTLAGLALLMLRRGEFPVASFGFLPERGLLLGWSVGVALASRWLLIRFGPWARRALGGS